MLPNNTFYKKTIAFMQKTLYNVRMKNIANIIKEKRKEKGISGDKIATMLNIHKTSYYRYESQDIKKMPLPIFEKLCSILGLDPLKVMEIYDPSRELLEKFNQLTKEDKQEILALIDFKLSRRQNNDRVNN